MNSAPRESYARLFLRFLRFGLLAWGGPVAQIAMIRQELVDEDRWITPERFNRVLAVYQALPGPEAHELCVYFGMLARGRLGGILAGLGFMLPGLTFMLALSWFYVTYGLASPLFAAIFYGCKPAVAALVVRAAQRLGSHALTDRWLWGLALLAALAQLLAVNFLITLAGCGLAYALIKRQWPAPAMAWAVIVPTMAAASAAAPTVWELLGYGLRTGLLTFGGAYTAIPFLRADAVVAGGWMTDAQFLDGLALGGILPAPLIIFGTFVGYLGGGLPGALALTTGIFAPAFAFTLIGHELVERLIANRALHAFLDGVTAGVVGLIAITALDLLRAALPDVTAAAIFALALGLLFGWRSKAATAAAVLGGGALGLVLTAAMP
jgi:chromate transporter